MVGVVLTVAIIQSIGVVLEIVSLKKRFHRSLDEQASMVTSLVGDAMVLPLWDFDMPQVENMLSDLLKNGSIGRVRLFSPDGSIVTQEVAKGFSPDGTDLVVSYDLEYTANSTAEHLGYLVVNLPTGELNKAIRKAIVQKLFLVVSTLALISLSLYLVLTRLSQPLVAFASAIKRIQCGELDLSIPGMERRDEIGKVALALDLLRRNEAEVRELRDLNDERTRQETQRIRLALESTRDAVVLTDQRGEIVFCNRNAQSLFFSEVKLGARLQRMEYLD